VDKDTTVVFPVPLMSTVEELAAFITRENDAGGGKAPSASQPIGAVAAAA